jgi:hypothetical protein
MGRGTQKRSSAPLRIDSGPPTRGQPPLPEPAKGIFAKPYGFPERDCEPELVARIEGFDAECAFEARHDDREAEQVHSRCDPLGLIGKRPRLPLLLAATCSKYDVMRSFTDISRDSGLATALTLLLVP